MDISISPRDKSFYAPEAPKRVQRIVRKLASKISELPVDQQRNELSKLRNIRSLVKHEVKKHRSKRHFKTDRRTRAIEPPSMPEEAQVPHQMIDGYMMVSSGSRHPRFVEESCLVDGEFQIYRIHLVPDQPNIDYSDYLYYYE